VTGGTLGFNQPVTSDPLFGQPVAIGGDGGSGPGRLVDTNPASFWSSQIFFGQFSIGGGNAVISGPRNFRMHSRWLDLNRIYTTDSALTQPAASVGACFQTCIPYDQVTWPAAGVSPLATKLQTAAQAAQGLMIRFTAYVNVYFRNGTFNGIPQRPCTYKDLAAFLATAWKEFDSTGKTSEFFSNPCYSHIVGSAGVWNAGEVASAPVGRYLAANAQVAAMTSAPAGRARAATTALPGHPRYQQASESIAQAAAAAIETANVAVAAAAASAPPQVTLGPIVATVDYDAAIISLDLNSTMPENGTPGEWPSDLSKANFGTLDFGVMNGGTFTSIAQIDYDAYSQSAYEASAGIIDIQLPSAAASLLQSQELLAIRVQGQIALLEQQLSAQTDSRGNYIDQGLSTSFDVTIYNLGQPSPNANLLVAQYDSNLSLIPTNGSPLVGFTTGDQQPVSSGGVTTNVTLVTADGSGVANVGIDSIAPGFAVLAFYPYTGTNLPSPATSLFGPGSTIYGSITYAFYATVRVLPFDNAVPQQFVDLWNSSQDPADAWNFIYGEILYVYDMMFNVMLEYVNLGSRSTVEANLSSIWSAISLQYVTESSYAMPITRDLSAGKRLALQLWIYLAANNYNVPNFNVNSIPANWAPPQQTRTR
ncbi:MAG TPA: hypothetical protein VN605_07155, partial [Thermoanaerobaculia bacterium]|nr:hypothetical protein [Thermoanaerobaculia bacterium]